MLVKIVNLSEDRFKNCRSTNFNNEYASFYGHKVKVPRVGSKGSDAAKAAEKPQGGRSAHMNEVFRQYDERVRSGHPGTEKTPEPEHRPGEPLG